MAFVLITIRKTDVDLIALRDRLMARKQRRADCRTAPPAYGVSDGRAPG
jgi:hypothetical protein